MLKELMIDVIHAFVEVLTFEFPETSKNPKGQLGKAILAATVPLETLDIEQLESLMRGLSHAAKGQAGYKDKENVIKCVEMRRSLVKSIERFKSYAMQGELSI